jgi:hypothetical protein
MASSADSWWNDVGTIQADACVAMVGPPRESLAAGLLKQRRPRIRIMSVAFGRDELIRHTDVKLVVSESALIESDRGILKRRDAVLEGLTRLIPKFAAGFAIKVGKSFVKFRH